MIKFIEISETKLKFAVYPNLKLIGYFIALTIFIPWLIWSLCFSPINSSLICYKTALNRVDCQLSESSLFNHHLSKINIKNLRKADKPFFRKSSVITLKANPNLLSLNIIGYQKTYYYPSNSLAIVNFKYLLPQNWLKPFNEIKKINQFIKGEIEQKSLVVQRSLNWIQLLIFGLLVIVIPLELIFGMTKGFFTMPVKTIYEFDGVNKVLTVLQNKIIEPNIIEEYSFEQINQVILNRSNQQKITIRYIFLQFNSNDDYLIDEFIDLEYGERNFQVIQNFLENNQ